jgi:hypothetical protein
MASVSCLGGGLRYDGMAISRGAQTERRGDAGPVRSLLDRTVFIPFYGRSVMQCDERSPAKEGRFFRVKFRLFD